jgi:hypothetical protein
MRASLYAAGFLLMTTPAVAQVHVAVSTDKAEYVEGEPMVVVLDVNNEGITAIGYPWDVSVSVSGAGQRIPPNLFGCSGLGMGEGSGSGRSSHEPTLKPGETQTFKYVVRGYDLAPGMYELHIVGIAGTGWSGGAAGIESTTATPASGQQNAFNRVHRVVVTKGDEAQLKQVMARFVTAARGTGRDSALAKEAIIEAAPSFLEPVIVEFAADVQLRNRAVAALGRINTQASRASLRSMFDSSDDIGFRRSIIVSLARTGERDNLEFFSRVLRETADSDPTVGHYAALGAGFIGGDHGVEALRSGTSASASLVRDGVAAALGNTKSADAVDVLVAMPEDTRDLSAVCRGLTSLTHWVWCDGTADLSSLKARWQRWWSENRSSTPIFGPENCPDRDAGMPLVR